MNLGSRGRNAICGILVKSKPAADGMASLNTRSLSKALKVFVAPEQIAAIKSFNFHSTVTIYEDTTVVLFLMKPMRLQSF